MVSTNVSDPPGSARARYAITSLMISSRASAVLSQAPLRANPWRLPPSLAAL